MLTPSEPREPRLTRPDELPVDDERISEQVRPHEWPDYRMSFWERVRAAWHLITKPDPEHERKGMEKVEQKHDIWSTIAGFVASAMLLVAEFEGLGDRVKTYILAGGFIVLGFLTNNWAQLLRHLPILAKQVIIDLTGRVKVEAEDDDDEEERQK